MRLSSDFWAAAFIRSVREAGGFAYLARRGAEEAGAIFISQTEAAAAAGQTALYGPAPQLFYDAGENGAAARGDRLFMRLMRGDAAAVSARLSQELKFDPDIWIIEVENFPELAAAANLRLVEAKNAKL